MRSGATTLWVAGPSSAPDPHLRAQRTARKPGRKGLKLVGVFKTLSEGRDLGTPIASSSRCPTGPGESIASHPASTKPRPGVRTARAGPPATSTATRILATACTLLGGVEREQGGYVFPRPRRRRPGRRESGQETQVAGRHRDRKVTLKPHKDGRLIVEIERKKDEKPIEGWEDKKGKYVKIFKVKAGPRRTTMNSTSMNSMACSGLWSRRPSSTTAG